MSLPPDDTLTRPVGPRDIPLLGLVLGYGPMLPFVGGLAAWLSEGAVRALVIELAIFWGCLVLVFLSGVRRGTSFFTAGGPRPVQIATMLWLFCLGGFALLAFAFEWAGVALVLLVLGFASIGVLDPLAARRGEVPAYFRTLRPPQMAIPVVCLLALLPLAWA